MRDKRKERESETQHTPLRYNASCRQVWQQKENKQTCILYSCTQCTAPHSAVQQCTAPHSPVHSVQHHTQLYTVYRITLSCRQCTLYSTTLSCTLCTAPHSAVHSVQHHTQLYTVYSITLSCTLCTAPPSSVNSVLHHTPLYTVYCTILSCTQCTLPAVVRYGSKRKTNKLLLYSCTAPHSAVQQCTVLYCTLL